jgi:hypothetical protein
VLFLFCVITAVGAGRLSIDHHFSAQYTETETRRWALAQ